jgi:hypothetical protein
MPMRCMPKRGMLIRDVCLREVYACERCLLVRDAYLQEMHACEMRMTSFPPFKAILDGGAGE